MGNKVIAINEVDFGSTGKIAVSVLNYLKNLNYETILCCHEFSDAFNNEYIISKNKFRYLFNKVLSRFDASDGFHSQHETKKLIKFLEKNKPNIIWLNNLHGSYINLKILLNWIKHTNTKVIWTLHDCWLFTGKCAHFTYCNCDKWKTVCNKCPNLKTHPKSYFFDKTKKLYKEKKNLFSGMESLITFVTPSIWLNDLLEFSYLSKFKRVVIHNGIELIKCKNEENKTDKINLFAAASNFDNRKGFNIINRLANELDPTKYLINVAGIIKEKDISKNINQLGIISEKEMAEQFALADAFLNPTYEDTFPTVNIESLSHGTPIITFENNGGCEIINDGCGSIIQYGNYDLFKKTILSLNKKDNVLVEKCIECSKKYSLEIMCKKYLELIEEISK